MLATLLHQEIEEKNPALCINFEDAILISERLIYEDIYTSIHIDFFYISY
jgi:hypothetical protein